MRIEERITIHAHCEDVWDFVTEPGNYLRFMDGVTRWEVQGELERGLGARYRMLMQVGSAQVGGLIEIVEWKPPSDMAWSSIIGIDQRGRWKLRDAGEGRTRVIFRFFYDVPGGLVALVAERVAALSLRRRIRRSLINVKRELEERRAASRAASTAELAG
jgi:uncharacterized membrane protein